MWAPMDILAHALMFLSLYFEVFLLITFLEHRPHKHRVRKPITHYPTATVIVPCYNEETTIGRTVASLLRLNYPKDKLSILLIDDGSTDTTWSVIENLKAQHPELSIIRKENGGKHTALNYGIQNTTSEIIGCLDADSFVDPDALLEIVAGFAETGAMAVIPAILVSEPRSLLQHMQKAEYTLSLFIRKIFSILNSNFVTPGPFSFFRREVFNEIGLYKLAHNTEDMEMAMRMQYHKMKIANAERAHVYTNTPASLGKLIRQRVRWTYGFIRNFVDYRNKLLFRKDYGNIGMFVLPMVFFAIFSSLVLAGLALTAAIAKAIVQVQKFQAMGFGSVSFSLDWFYFNTQSMILLTLTVIGITLSFIMFGKSISGQKTRPSFDMLVYLLMYGLVAPMWLAKSVYNASILRPTSWTAERAVSKNRIS